MAAPLTIGLILGEGDLPLAVIDGCRTAGHEMFIARLEGYAAPNPDDIASESFGLAKFGAMTKAFKAHGCTHVCFAGNVHRPDFKTLKPDFKGFRRLPGAIAAARQGDDALLRYIVQTFEADGFSIVSPQTLCAHILMPEGHLGAVTLSDEHRGDAEKACRIAREIGRLDIGQGAVVADGLVLAVEAQEGTDGMLRRVADLPETLRGTAARRRGVLAKMVKPGQETRVDLPTIGPDTVALAQAAGLAGIVTEGGQSFVLDKAAVIAAADKAQIFIAGLPSAQANSDDTATEPD